MKKNRYVLWLMLAVLAAAALNQQFGSAGSAPADAPAAGSRPAATGEAAAPAPPVPPTPAATAAADSGSQAIAQAFAERRSDVQVAGAGQVQRTLPDDNHGSRHQRFILKLDNGHTVLVAHNIDLAPRLEGLRRGDRVAFYGEYEYNEQGGVLHWTHHDPRGKHPDGWLEYRGRRYQ